MSIHTLPYQNTGYFSKLMCDYLEEKEGLQSFYGHFPILENFELQIKEKQASFNPKSRATLVQALESQYKTIDVSEATSFNIASLSEANTFTITTGHQLNLFTGPLYFLYKIFSVINLTEKLKAKYPKFNFVPVYWMATEDHDFEEINYFNLFGNKLAWNRESGGAVGALSTKGLDQLHEILKAELGTSENAQKLSELFALAYKDHSNLADATRYLGNQLFSDYGLVIIDGNDSTLKRAFIPYAEKEIIENHSHKNITKTSHRLKSLGYPEQVFPREINMFYVSEGLRERIVEQDGSFQVNQTDLVFTRDELLKLLDNTPENFSPNALLRPLYQEVILPNLCYIGGGGELAYWFQLKDYFESVAVPFPILLLRNSVLLMSEKQSEKLGKLNSNVEALFLPGHKLEALYTKVNSSITIDFSKQKTFLVEQFKSLHELAKETDASFEGAVAALETKQIHGLIRLENRILKAQTRKHQDQLMRLTAIQDQLFPKQNLQERTMNFSEFYLVYGADLFSELKEHLDPLVHAFTIVTL
jgi:bacillithiol biosynthesis cysteine-adding enzyme BshC